MLMYFVVTLCSHGQCEDFSNKVELMPGMLPVHACAFVGQQQAMQIAGAHPGWHIERWSCSEKAPAQSM